MAAAAAIDAAGRRYRCTGRLAMIWGGTPRGTVPTVSASAWSSWTTCMHQFDPDVSKFVERRRAFPQMRMSPVVSTVLTVAEPRQRAASQMLTASVAVEPLGWGMQSKTHQQALAMHHTADEDAVWGGGPHRLISRTSTGSGDGGSALYRQAQTAKHCRVALHLAYSQVTETLLRFTPLKALLWSAAQRWQ